MLLGALITNVSSFSLIKVDNSNKGAGAKKDEVSIQQAKVLCLCHRAGPIHCSSLSVSCLVGESNKGAGAKKDEVCI